MVFMMLMRRTALFTHARNVVVHPSKVVTADNRCLQPVVCRLGRPLVYGSVYLLCRRGIEPHNESRVRLCMHIYESPSKRGKMRASRGEQDHHGPDPHARFSSDAVSFRSGSPAEAFSASTSTSRSCSRCSSAAFIFSPSSSPLVSSVCLISSTAATVATAFRPAFKRKTVRKPRTYAPRIVCAVSGERPREASVDEEAEVRAPRTVGSSTIAEIVDGGRERAAIVCRRELFLCGGSAGLVSDLESG